MDELNDLCPLQLILGKYKLAVIAPEVTQGQADMLVKPWRERFDLMLKIIATPTRDEPGGGEIPQEPAALAVIREAVEAAFEEREGWRTKIAAAVRALGDAAPAAPSTVPDGLIERLKGHSEDKRNTAFARSSMREAIEYLSAALVVTDARDQLAALIDIYDDAMNHPPESRTYVDGAFAQQMDEARALLAGLPAAPAPSACQTCNDHGMIGGPSYYAPDEGGEPCPDCAAPSASAQQGEPVAWFEADESARGGDIRTLVRSLVHSTRWHWQSERPVTGNPVWPLYAAPSPAASPEGCNCHLGRGDHAFGCPAASAEGEWKRMFEDAARDMAAIDAALGIDPEEAGGAEPILAAIEELKATASPAAPQSDRTVSQIVEALKTSDNECALSFSAKEMRAVLNVWNSAKQLAEGWRNQAAPSASPGLGPVDADAYFGKELRVYQDSAERKQSIARAVAANGGIWPAQLESGVMFYEGERITRADFEAAVRASKEGA